jgi:hypothetical protein
MSGALMFWWMVVLLMVLGLVGWQAMIEPSNIANSPGLFLSFYGCPVFFIASAFFCWRTWK